MNTELLRRFVDDILDDHNGVQPNTIFETRDPHEDLKCTFLSFLVSRCILRLAPGYMGGNVYKFSKPGRVIMGDDVKRTAFIEEFLVFYTDNPELI